MRTPLLYSPQLGERLRLQARPTDHSLWMTLDSGRKEVFCAHPLEVISLQAADNAGTLRSQLKAALQRLPQSPHLKDLSFRGGLAGFLGYDLVAKDHAPDFPRAWMGLYSSFLYIDHNKKTAEVIELPGFSDIAYKWKDLLRELNDGYAPPSLPSFSLTSPFIALTSADRYRQDFARIQQYLQDGDCYQVNYAQAFRASARGSSASAMQRLLEISRPSHAAWLSLPEGDVLSLSPELFLKVEQGRITTKPIKGTAPRSADPVTDEETARALQASPKNRAENLMIVDLLRHDLSRHAETGSVRVEKLFEIESLPQVHHLVSTIIGNIKKESHVIDLIMDSFPGGSITGAPKKRAMEIIAELEPTPRSVYCGSIGFINGDGDCELNIAIRTLLRLGDDIYTWAGGGIVADSACEAEYQECFDKIGALMRTLEGMGQD